jgi:hypothetical protein
MPVERILEPKGPKTLRQKDCGLNKYSGEAFK